MQTCQVSQNFRDSPDMVHDLQVSRKCLKKISRNLGNLTAFGVNPRGFGVNPRNSDHRDLKLAPDVASGLRLHKQLIC